MSCIRLAMVSKQIIVIGRIVDFIKSGMACSFLGVKYMRQRTRFWRIRSLLRRNLEAHTCTYLIS